MYSRSSDVCSRLLIQELWSMFVWFQSVSSFGVEQLVTFPVVMSML